MWFRCLRGMQQSVSAIGSCSCSLSYGGFQNYLTAQLLLKIKLVFWSLIFVCFSGFVSCNESTVKRMCLFLFLSPPLLISVFNLGLQHPAGNVPHLTWHQLLQAGYSCIGLVFPFLLYACKSAKTLSLGGSAEIQVKKWPKKISSMR